MAETLRPCPFCGGEANLMSDYSSEHNHTFWQVLHDCRTNPGPIRHTYGHALSLEISTPWCASEDAAVELWNRRVERTCEPVELIEEETFGTGIYFECSECRETLGISSKYGSHLPNYCPHCGARVVQ